MNSTYKVKLRFFPSCIDFVCSWKCFYVENHQAWICQENETAMTCIVIYFFFVVTNTGKY